MAESTTLITLAVLIVIPYLLCAGYQCILPQPISGIPFNKKSVRSLFGDALAVVEHVRTTGRVADWVTMQGTNLNSPIFQVFPKPFSKPWVS
jgi:hypothetical protein